MYKFPLSKLTFTSHTPVGLLETKLSLGYGMAKIYETDLDTQLEKVYGELNHTLCFYFCNYEQEPKLSLKDIFLGKK